MLRGRGSRAAGDTDPAPERAGSVRLKSRHLHDLSVAPINGAQFGLTMWKPMLDRRYRHPRRCANSIPQKRSPKKNLQLPLKHTGPQAAAGARSGGLKTVEPQEWSEGRAFPGRYSIDDAGPTLERALGWGAGGTIWIDGSRLDSGGVGAAYAWKAREGWMGRRFYLGNKEASDAGVLAIPGAEDLRREAGGGPEVHGLLRLLVGHSAGYDRHPRAGTAVGQSDHRGGHTPCSQGQRGNRPVGPSAQGSDRQRACRRPGQGGC